jgi:hypothetical protein
MVFIRGIAIYIEIRDNIKGVHSESVIAKKFLWGFDIIAEKQ